MKTSKASLPQGEGDLTDRRAEPNPGWQSRRRRQDDPGWDVVDIGHGGSYVRKTQSIRWIFMDAEPRTLSYRVIAAGEPSPRFEPSGLYSVDGAVGRSILNEQAFTSIGSDVSALVLQRRADGVFDLVWPGFGQVLYSPNLHEPFEAFQPVFRESSAKIFRSVPPGFYRWIAE